MLQLLLMKRGGELIYAGVLGPKSCKLIEYFEVIEYIVHVHHKSEFFKCFLVTWTLTSG